MAAPQVGLVDDVVVQQRRRVDHFDHGRQNVVILPAIAGRARSEEQQGRAQPLAAARDDVLGDLADEDDLGGKGLAHDAVDGGHVRADRGLEEFDDHESGRKSGWRGVRDRGLGRPRRGFDKDGTSPL